MKILRPVPLLSFQFIAVLSITVIATQFIDGSAYAACNTVTSGTIQSTVWRNGASDGWRPEAAGGGVTISTANVVAVNATSPWAKIKFSANAAIHQNSSDFEYVEFAVRASTIGGDGAKVSAYIWGDQIGDTFDSRCAVMLTRQWQTVRVSLEGVGVAPGSEFRQLRFRNDSGAPLQFTLNNISFGKAAPDSPQNPEPQPNDPNPDPRPGQPAARCTASPSGVVKSTAWSSGPSSQWGTPVPLGGGVTVTANTTINVNSTANYGKIKIPARNGETGNAWLQFDLKLINASSTNPGVEAYIYSSETGDSFEKRCLVRATTQWRRYRLPLSAFGATTRTPIDQLRFRNGSGAAIQFSLDNVVLGGNADSDPEDPVDPDDPDNPSIPPGSALPGAERLVNWSTSVGADPVADENLTVRKVFPAGAGTDASVEINQKLNVSNDTIVELAAGRYTLRNPIRISGHNKVLRGAPGGQVVLSFVGVRGAAIQIGGDYSPGGDIKVSRANKGSRFIKLNTTAANAQALMNQVIEIDRLRDTIALDEPDRDIIFTRGNSDRWPGQLNRVIDVVDTTLKVASPLVLDYQAGSLAPAVRRLKVETRNIGVENLTLSGSNLQKLSSGIFAKGVTNIWVRNVISRGMARKSHVELVAVFRCSIQSSVFDDAQTHSDGGEGYGINLQRHTTGCLIEDNIFHRLRHSMIINLGAAGNALLYNFSTEPVHPNFEVGGPADISLHGNYSSGNLIEGNAIQRVSITDDCCKAERHNTLLRNCLLSSPLTLNRGSDGQNMVANAIYGSDSALRRTLIDGGRTGVPGGKPALRSVDGSLFETPQGRDGVFVHPDSSYTNRYDELSRDLIEYANYHNGRYWYNQKAGPAPDNVPTSYFYLNNIAQRRSIFASPPAPILTNPGGTVDVDCDIPARRRAPRFIQ